MILPWIPLHYAIHLDSIAKRKTWSCLGYQCTAMDTWFRKHSTLQYAIDNPALNGYLCTLPSTLIALQSTIDNPALDTVALCRNRFHCAALYTKHPSLACTVHHIVSFYQLVNNSYQNCLATKQPKWIFGVFSIWDAVIGAWDDLFTT